MVNGVGMKARIVSDGGEKKRENRGEAARK